MPSASKAQKTRPERFVVWDLYKQIKSGKMPSVKLRGAVKVKREDLEEYINTNRRS